MKKLLIIFLSLACIQLFASGNKTKVKLGLRSGYSFCAQNDLTLLNSEVMDQLPFNVAVIDDFKPVFYWGGYIQHALFNRFHAGPSYEYYFSGSRLGVKDYSAAFLFDQFIHKHQVGLKLDYLLLIRSKFDAGIELNMGANITDWKIISEFFIEDFEVFNNFQNDHLTGLSWFVEPSLSIKFQLIDQLAINAFLGYSFDLIKRYQYKGKDADYIIIKSPDWSGLKLSLGLEIRIW